MRVRAEPASVPSLIKSPHVRPCFLLLSPKLRRKTFMASPAHPQLERDPVKLDPKHYSVELENVHQHPRGVVVFLSEAHFKFTFPDGKTEELRKKPGEIVAYTEPWEHQPENLSGKEFEAVYVEIKK